MTTVYDMTTRCEQWAPSHLALDWDNCGLQLGSYDQSVTSCLLSLDIDLNVLHYIETHPIDLIITHHPLFFDPITALDASSDIGQCVYPLVKKDISVYSMHTNLDATENGVTDTLINTYGLDPTRGTAFKDGIGKWIGLDTPIPLETLTSVMPGRLKGNAPDTISRIAFCGGSGKSLIPECRKENIELFITGEVGYHDVVSCAFYNIAVLLLGHKPSEEGILPVIQNYLQPQFPEVLFHRC